MGFLRCVESTAEKFNNDDNKDNDEKDIGDIADSSNEFLGQVSVVADAFSSEPKHHIHGLNEEDNEKERTEVDGTAVPVVSAKAAFAARQLWL